MKDYLLRIDFDVDDVYLDELVAARLFVTPSTGSTSDANGVEAYFDSPEERDAALAALSGIDGLALSTAERDRVDWLDLYQQSLEPLEIGERFVVAPDPSLLPPDSGRLQLVIPQEQAFGTGSHETTSLCLELLEPIVEKGHRGLDVGAGSGILALAMLRLGAAKAIAFDNDPDAFGALRDNRLRNGIAPERLPLFIGSIEALRGGTFDVVTMNIIPEVILPLLPDVVPHVAGALILSGILTIRAAEVVDHARRAGLHLVAEKTRGEWWAGVLRR
jgi:ribosomal protein L11 methyltransferase